jgi:hypothetical protein
MEPGVILDIAERFDKLGIAGAVIATMLLCSIVHGIALWRVWAFTTAQRSSMDAVHERHLSAIETQLAQIEAALTSRG